jgi:NAD(P)-dependent dehydrogenase (short-subunit alcohol dehydrogenase family)
MCVAATTSAGHGARRGGCLTAINPRPWGHRRGKENPVRIIVVGGAGTIGKAAVKALSDRHEVVVAGRRSGTVQVDIRSPDSVRTFYHQVGSFDALVCAAGDAYLGPFDSMSEADFVLGIESKLPGQIRLVLLGRSLISEGARSPWCRVTSSTIRSRSGPPSRSQTAGSKASSAPPPSASTAVSGSTP